MVENKNLVEKVEKRNGFCVHESMEIHQYMSRQKKLVTDFNIKNKIGFVIFLHYLC